MNNARDKALLPSGLYDLLPPDARQQSDVIAGLLAGFAHFGYEQVNPPLMEFEDTLLAGRGSTLSNQTFRVMDPISRAMMGVRADMTMQVVRIATSRLAAAPRPLRLSYAGPILQVKAEALKSERQLFQVGAELIGASSPEADAEVITVAVEALQRLGVTDLSVDLNLPGYVEHLISAASNQDAVRQAITRKDVSALLGADAPLLKGLIEAAGPAESALAKLGKLALSAAFKNEFEKLKQVVSLLGSSLKTVAITIDPLEARGFEYHNGISFSLFARGAKHELGRGGRYIIDDTNEDATGFTLYLSPLLGILPPAEKMQRLLVPNGTPSAERKDLRDRGYITVYGLTKENDAYAEAKRLGCTHIYHKGQIEKL